MSTRSSSSARPLLAGLIGTTVLLSGCSDGGGNRARRLSLRGCAPAAHVAPALSGVSTATVSLPARPYSVVTSPSGRWSFVSLPNAIAVISQKRFVPRPSRLVSLPASAGGAPHGLALVAHGRYLLASAASGAVVLDALRAERGLRHPVLGRLLSPVYGLESQAGAGAIVGSRTGRYVFVARQRAGGVAVFDLHRALASHFARSGLVGVVRVGLGPTALALSPSGLRLYVTSVASPLQSGATTSSGTLSVLDVRRAEVAPWRSVLGVLPAGCEPVGVATGSGGRLVWVATLADHSVLGFLTSRLLGDPARALVASVRVGPTPLGLLAFDRGRRLLVADSAASTGGAVQSVSVIDTTRALRGGEALIGSVNAGVDPRQLALVPGRSTALLTNYGSSQLEAIDLAQIP